jgi:hypothetical protein
MPFYLLPFSQVKCTVKDCRTAFHMSCAWLAGHKISKVECPHVMNRGAPELFLPITYRYCACVALHVYRMFVIYRKAGSSHLNPMRKAGY